MRRKIGLIINPIAGIGGRVGLKGSDGEAVQRRALALGATPQAGARAALALEQLRPLQPGIAVLVFSDEMGEDIARSLGFTTTVLGQIRPGATTAEDTRRAARAMQTAGVELLLFAGGDGTARDVAGAVEMATPVLGIPTGVKMHSAVFAVTPRAAGELALAYLQGRSTTLREAEVMDLDEAGYRAGVISPSLYGYLRVPASSRWLQNKKAPTPASEQVQFQAIAADVVEQMQPGWLYVLGPGSAPRAVAEQLGIAKTLVGVDVATCDGMVAEDVGEMQLLQLIADEQTQIVVTPIGGQGFLFGRGNQQISPAVLRAVGREHLVVVAALAKLLALQGRPLLVDTGDAEVDAHLAGYYSIITGYHERIMYRVA